MRLYLLLIGFAWVLSGCTDDGGVIKINVDANQVDRRLKGGMGASWHAISRELPLNNHLYEFPVREKNARGSAWGGNPPVTSEAAWRQLGDHAAWLGLNWIRVELSQRMYEPERGLFDWDNEEMQALYRILDWSQANDVDVFLQQMWGYVEWNAFPGVHPLLSAPRSTDDFAEGIGTLLDHLVRQKGYSCIKYVSIVNEPPGGTWGYWWSEGFTEGSVTPAWKRVRQELDQRDLDVILSAPDWTDLPPFDEKEIDFDDFVSAYDIHSYHGIGDEGEDILAAWVKWANDHGKPFFLTEFGNMNLGWGDDDPAPASFEAALSNAVDIVRGLRAGVDAFNRWSFTNRGDLDGQWQLVRTWDRDDKKYLDAVVPEPEAYFGYGIITRFIAKYADVIHASSKDDYGELHFAALRNPGGELSVILVNNGEKGVDVSLNMMEADDRQFYLYCVTKQQISTSPNPLDPEQIEKAGNSIQLNLPPYSISNVSQVFLEGSMPGIIK